MTFRITVKVDPIAIEFEAGSLAEAHNILTTEGTALDALMSTYAGTSPTSPAAPVSGDVPEKRKRRTKAEIEADNAKVAAQTPDPLPAPPAATSVTSAATSEEPAIPPFLQRTAATPTPPPLANAPSIAPPPPPAVTAPNANALCHRIVAELKRRAESSPDKGQALADWVATTGLLAKGATFDECVTIFAFQFDDAKVKPIADALGVA